MTRSDSLTNSAWYSPRSFRFWIAASAGVVVLTGAMILSRGSPDSAHGHDANSDGGVVISLRDPAHAAPADGANGSSHGGPDHGAKSSPEEISALTAANGAVVIDPAVTRNSPDGPTPFISPDGRKPMGVYAAKFDMSDGRPRVTILVTGLGLQAELTQEAIDKLPPGTTLALSPYGDNLQNWTAAARAKGHEVVLEVPMEPFDYPDQDPGPQTLLTGPGAGENQGRLTWALGRFAGYAGVVNAQGGKFLASEVELGAFMTQIASRGLYMVDVGFSQRSVSAAAAKAVSAPFARAEIQLDRTPSGDAVDAALERLTKEAQEKRFAIGAATATPGTIARIAAWAAGLDAKGVAIAPASAVLPLADRAGP